MVLILWVNFVGATEKTALSDAYKKTGVAVIEKQVLVGGLRLAETIKRIYGSSNEEDSFEVQIEEIEEEASIEEVAEEVEEVSEEVEVQAFLQWEKPTQ